MDANTLGTLILGGGGVAVVVWVLNKIGKALTAILEALATIAAVAVGVWLAVKAVGWAVRNLVTHWRTSIAAVLVVAWWLLLGWPSLAITAGVVTVALLVWRHFHRLSFDRSVGRRIRSWWQRWTIYARKLPRWIDACGLVVREHDRPIHVTVNPLARNKVRRQPKPHKARVPKVLGVKSGPSWDEVRVRLVPGQTPEDFDAATRALATARGVNRCQVREIKPNVVSIDFQRRNLLTAAVPCRDLTELSTVPGAGIDLKKVYAGRTEYGTDWFLSLAGSHTLGAGATGAGKGSLMWCPLVSAAPAIRDGLVRPWGIDPKGMELAYGRRIFGDRYAVTGKDALGLLDELVATMDKRKAEFAGKTRSVPVSRDNPLDVLEFDEIGTLTKYIGDRRLREQIIDRVALLTTQGRALNVCVRGYVQEPTKDTVPVRDLFPRRVCMRVAAKSHVTMVLGDQAHERGAWANRITEHEAGVGYLFGEGVREPLRVRVGWVPDETIKALEAFVTGDTGPGTGGTVLSMPTKPLPRNESGVA
ncbi:S-DNA-T family DNA segregation ATPase FtsK/SpoIIIE [Herbihabitans rhizosphaerae]|uniref:S-DNA-T family DNA segregation ATPase FtsK/SpoIIIE n=1 Tax=Herbihabitans rhizosphaerae TaxID=1872711 RepID=A0A4Q7KN88_9PSEU|nr:cell division protein FtsK [Herbihabitans rhizosphaerae]RZS37834.1 S-DNA-T family DNA segregation ATPase FtsK/SpoIIIE [Herbihabitans rhizosphaerae]